MLTHREEKRDTPIVEDVDVVVCGGGPAGIAAAIASARQGARTRLIELHGSLGGVWTTGALSWIIDSADKPGIMAENYVSARCAGCTQASRPGWKELRV